MLSVHNEWEDMEFTENMNLLYLSRGFKKFPTRGYLKFRFTSLFISLRTVFTLSKYLKTTKPEFLFVSMMPFIAWISLKLSRNNNTNLLLAYRAILEIIILEDSFGEKFLVAQIGLLPSL